jgi:hypothetical protein
MIYVAVVYLAVYTLIELPPYIDMARAHWEVCSRLAAEYRQEAANCRLTGVLYPGDTIVARDVVYRTKAGKFVPITGGMWAKLAPYYDALANIYESAKWRVWAGMPTEPLPPTWQSEP